jgi:hypothetical protein
MECSQIWLSPLVDGCQSTYCTTLGKKKKHCLGTMISFQQILSFSQKEIYKNCWILKNVNSTNFANISGNF